VAQNLPLPIVNSKPNRGKGRKLLRFFVPHFTNSLDRLDYVSAT